MSETLRDLVVSLSLNSDNFSRNIKSINKQIQEAESAFRMASAGVENFETTTAGLSSKLSTLQRTFQLQQDAVSQYERALQQASDKLQECYTRQNDYAQRLADAKDKQQLKTEVASAAQAYKHYKNTLGETDSATIAAKANLDAYKGEYRAAVQEVKKLESQNIALKKSMQNAADAFSAAQTKLNGAKGAVKETAAEIDQCNRQLALSRTSWASAGEAIQASQRSIASIGKQMKTAESSYRLAAAGVKDFDKSAAGLTAKLTLLQEKLGLQQKAVAEYEKALAAAKEQLQAAQQVNDPDKIREATDAVQDAETALNNARAAVKQTQADIANCNKELKTAQSEWTKAEKSLEGRIDMNEKRMTLTRMEAPAQLPVRKRVAAYARVSMEKDAMLHSLAAQVSYYSERIQRNPEWEYAGVFADFGLTGTKETRPEFQRMLKECREGKIDLILVKSISRFARNTLTLLNTVRELKGLGIGVYFEEQKLDTLSGDGEFMLTILASFAQEESRSVSENCKWRIRKKFEQGIPTGFGMYGYEVRNGSFVIKPEEAAVVRRIFQMYLEGMGSVKIMKLLTEEGVPAPLGGLWNASVVMEMLKNEKYAGDLLLQKFYTNNHVEKKRFHNRGELPQYFVGEDHEPIIDRETFDAVQRKIAWRTTRRKAKRNVQEAASVASSGSEHTPPSGNNRREAIPLTDRIYCGVCGKKYRYKVTRLGTPYAAPVWICSTFNYRGKAYCASKQIPEDILKELIISVLGTVHTEDSVHHIEMHPGRTERVRGIRAGSVRGIDR